MRPHKDGVRKWVFLTKHTRLRLLWGDENYPALRVAVLDDDGASTMSVEIPKRTWTRQTETDLTFKVIQFPMRLGFCTTIHSAQGCTLEEFYHALPCHLQPFTPTL